MINYQMGKIYKVVNDVNDIIYIGSTAQPKLCNRMRDHRSRSQDLSRTSTLYTAMRSIGVAHFKIVLICLYPCSTKEELEAKEFMVINELKADGQDVYNSIINGKHSEETKNKCTFNRHSYGCVRLDMSGSRERYKYVYKRKDLNLNIVKSFSINKYGDKKAKELAEQAKEQTKTRVMLLEQK